MADEISQFLSNGAEPDIENNNGQTALDILQNLDAKMQADGKKSFAAEGIDLLEKYGVTDRKKSVQFLTNDHQNNSGQQQTETFTFNPETTYTPIGLKKLVHKMTEDELLQYSTQYNSFLQQLITTGLVIDALEKMSYNKTKKLYHMAQPKMSSVVRNKAEELIRNKR